MSKSLSTTKETDKQKNTHERIVLTAFTRAGMETLEKQLMPIIIKDQQKARDMVAIIRALSKLR